MTAEEKTLTVVAGAVVAFALYQKRAEVSEVFTGRTRKVLDSLTPDFRAAVEAFLSDARAAGLSITLTNGRRTLDEQAQLYAQGRTAPGDVVTNAKPGESPHNFGMAVDFAFVNAAGQPSWPSTAPWETVGALGEARGMTWGGRWASFPDRPHLEWPAWKLARTEWKRTGQLPA